MVLVLGWALGCADEQASTVQCPQCSSSGAGGGGGAGGNSESVTLAWANMWGDPAFQKAMSVAIDKDDQTYVSGYYSGHVDLGDGQELPDIGEAFDSFVMKLDNTGKVLWAHTLGQAGVKPQDAERVVVTVDPMGNLVLAGNVINTTTVGITMSTSFTQVAMEPEMFVAKLDDEGALLWAVSGGSGLASLMVRDVACDARGNVVVVGRFEGDSGGELFAGQTVAPTGEAIFAAELSGADGAPVWGHAYSHSTLYAFPSGVAVDAAGNTVIVGDFDDQLELGGMPLGSSQKGVADAFVIRLNPQGEVDWAKAFGVSGDQLATDVGVDSGGAIYFTGNNHGSIEFGRTSHQSDPSNYDVFVAKLDPMGAPVWSWSPEETGPQLASALTVANDHLVFGGHFQQNLPITTPPLASQGGNDIFVASFALDNTPAWSRSIGGTLLQQTQAVAIGPTGAVVVVGYSEGDLELGPDIVPNNGVQDIVVARFEP